MNVFRHFRTYIGCIKRFEPKSCYSTSTSNIDSKPINIVASESQPTGTFINLIKRYEDIIGLTAVREAQDNVIEQENKFATTQDARRGKQDELRSLQMKLKEIHSELDKTSRGEDKYLHLLTQEHSLIKQERNILEQFQHVERDERVHFHRLSACVRESHEKERERGERTKYWSIIGSGIGALIGITGTTINNRLRMREFKNIVHDSSDPIKTQKVITDLSDMVQAQQGQVRAFVNDLRGILNKEQVVTPSDDSLQKQPSDLQVPNLEILSQQSEAILTAIKEQDNKLDNEMNDVKKLIAIEHGYKEENDGTIVYIGPEMTSLLEETERNLEWKMKLQTLLNVVAVYGALAITLPVLYAIFRGP